MLVLQGAKERIEYLSFSPDGVMLLAQGHLMRGIQIWQKALTGEPPGIIPRLLDEGHLMRGWVHSIRFVQNGRAFLIDGSQVAIHDLSTNQGTAVTYPQPYQNEAAVQVSPDGLSFLSAQCSVHENPRGRLIYRTLADPTSDLWTVQTSRHFQSPPFFLQGGHRFLVIEWWNGESGFDYGPAFVTRDTETREVVSEVRKRREGHAHPCSFAVLSPDQRFLVARTGRWIGVYESNDFTIDPVLLQNDSKKDFTGVAFHPSGRYLAATSNDEAVSVYNTERWNVVRKFNWEIGRLRCVTFSADGSLAACGGDKGQVVIWDVDL